jgi:hypothetical protein
MKVRFWIKTSRQFDAEDYQTVPDDTTDDELDDMLHDWALRVFPRFYVTDSVITTGWEEYEKEV